TMRPNGCNPVVTSAPQFGPSASGPRDLGRTWQCPDCAPALIRTTISLRGRRHLAGKEQVMFSALTRRRFSSAAALSVLLLSAMSACQAAELEVPVSIALRGGVGEMATQFGKRTGHTVKVTPGAPGEIAAALKAGRHADLVVLP